MHKPDQCVRTKTLYHHYLHLLLITLLLRLISQLARSCDVFIVEIAMFCVKHLLFMYDQSLSRAEWGKTAITHTAEILEDEDSFTY